MLTAPMQRRMSSVCTPYCFTPREPLNICTTVVCLGVVRTHLPPRAVFLSPLSLVVLQHFDVCAVFGSLARRFFELAAGRRDADRSGVRQAFYFTFRGAAAARGGPRLAVRPLKLLLFRLTHTRFYIVFSSRGC